jgi:hypothetical protein
MEQVSACLVTRGDVDMQPIIDSLPSEWEVIVWSNGSMVYSGGIHKWPSGTRGEMWHHRAGRGVLDGYWPDLSVYGRYAAIEHASHDLIYVADDDVIVSDPQVIVDAWLEEYARRAIKASSTGPLVFSIADYIVCNMPMAYRHGFYTDNALVGFGSCFHRDAPERAFQQMLSSRDCWNGDRTAFFDRTCDIAFTGLSERVLVDVPITHLHYATGPDRMYRQATHVAERTEMRELVRRVAGR